MTTDTRAVQTARLSLFMHISTNKAGAHPRKLQRP
jgi:hypothetical protein